MSNDRKKAKNTLRETKAPLAEWTKLSYTFAEYRLTSMVEVGDVQQVTYFLVVLQCV